MFDVVFDPTKNAHFLTMRSGNRKFTVTLESLEGNCSDVVNNQNDLDATPLKNFIVYFKLSEIKEFKCLHCGQIFKTDFISNLLEKRLEQHLNCVENRLVDILLTGKPTKDDEAFQYQIEPKLTNEAEIYFTDDTISDSVYEEQGKRTVMKNQEEIKSKNHKMNSSSVLDKTNRPMKREKDAYVINGLSNQFVESWTLMDDEFDKIKQLFTDYKKLDEIGLTISGIKLNCNALCNSEKIRSDKCKMVKHPHKGQQENFFSIYEKKDLLPLTDDTNQAKEKNHELNGRENGRKHIKMHGKNLHFTNDKRSYRSFQKKNLSQKYNRKIPLKATYKCKQCKKIFISQKNLKLHERFHVSKIAQKINKIKASINQMTSHCNLKNCKCKFCPKSFPDQEQLFKHEQEIHTALYFCDLCKRSFTRSFSLRRHDTNIHKKNI